ADAAACSQCLIAYRPASPRLWNAKSGAFIKDWSKQDAASDLGAISPAGDLLALAGQAQIHVFDTRVDKPRLSFPVEGGPITALALHGPAGLLAFAGTDRTLTIVSLRE